MTLREAQSTFAANVAKLVFYIFDSRHECTFDWAYRPAEVAQMYAKQGKGISESLHCYRLAVDMNIYFQGQYMTDRATYEPFGKWWKSLHSDNRWGGDFANNDYRHFSMVHKTLKAKG